MYIYTLYPLGVLYLEHSQLSFDSVAIACRLESFRPGLIQGGKAPNCVSYACLITSSESGFPHWIRYSMYALTTPPPGLKLANIGPSQETPSLLILYVLYIPTHRHVVGGYHMTSCQNPWGHSTDTDNRHHNVLACSLADITDCTTSPVKSIGNLCDCPFAMTASIYAI